LKAPAAVTPGNCSRTQRYPGFLAARLVTPEIQRHHAAIIDEWVRRPLDFEPGTDWQYSHGLCGRRRRRGESLGRTGWFEFLRRHVFEPLHGTRRGILSTPWAKAMLKGTRATDRAGGFRHPGKVEGWLFRRLGSCMQPATCPVGLTLINRSLLKAESYKRSSNHRLEERPRA